MQSSVANITSPTCCGLSDSTHGTGPSRFVRVPIPAEGAADFRPPASVYEQAVHRYAGSVERDDLLWQERVSDIREAASHGRNIYIYLGLRNETPVSYLIYTFESNPGRGRTLKVDEAFAVDAASFADVLGFLSTHDAQAHGGRTRTNRRDSARLLGDSQAAVRKRPPYLAN